MKYNFENIVYSRRKILVHCAYGKSSSFIFELNDNIIQSVLNILNISFIENILCCYLKECPDDTP